MNLPWDKSYFKLCFYIIFTFIIIYIFKNAVDLVVYALINMGGIYRGVLKSVSAVFSVFSVIIIGFLIAYLLNPLVEYFFKSGLKRGLSVMMAFFVILIFALVVFGGIFLDLTDFGKYTVNDGIEKQFEIFSANLDKITLYVDNVSNRFNINITTDIKEGIFNYINKKYIYILGKWGTELFLGMIISIYFLKDKKRIITNLKKYYGILPNKITDVVTYLLKNLDKAFSGYIKGQFADAVILSAIISLVLSLIGVPFSVPIGILSGLLNVIPYFGAIFAFIMTVGITILSGQYIKALYAAIAIFVIQQIDGMFIVPKIVGESVRLSPVVVIIALAAAANMFGIWGMIFVIPIISFFKFIIEDYIKAKQNSRGED